jgi:hypothetical protein
MALRVISTKLSEEEHTALLDACNVEGQTPSSFTRAAIFDKLGSKEMPARRPEVVTIEQLSKATT